MGVEFLLYEQRDFEYILEIEKSRGDAWSENQLAEQLKGSGNYVLRVNGQCIAYAFFQVVLNQADLLLLVVNKEFRQKGYANTLLKRAMEQLSAENIEVFFLEVRRSNQAAINLYQKHQFKTDGFRKNYYQMINHQDSESSTEQIREDAVLMSFRLEGS